MSFGSQGGLEQLNRELIDELARVFWQPGLARIITLRAGFPPRDVPAFTTALGFWSLIVRAAEDGKISRGTQAVVDEAVQQYPCNELFLDYARTYAQLLESSSPDPRSVPGVTPPDGDRLRSSCAELFIGPNGKPAGMTQAIAPTKLLTCAHLVERTNTVWLRPWGTKTKVEATVIRDAADTNLDVVLLHCSQWPRHGSVSPISRELPAVGARVTGFYLASAVQEQYPGSDGMIEGIYFGLGDGRRRVTVRGDPWEERFSGALLYDTDSSLAWGMASTSGSRSNTLKVGAGLNIATSIDAILERFESYLDGVEPKDTPHLSRHRALGEQGWALLWHTGTLATKRAVHQHLPFFVKGDSPSPDDIARGEAYPRRAAADLAEFFSARAWEAPRCGVITGQRGDGKTTLALLTARLLHERGTQVLLHRGSGEPDFRACAKVLKVAPALFLVERPRVGVAWYQNLADYLADIHSITGQATDVLLVDPSAEVLGAEYGQIMADMRRATPARLLEANAAPSFAELDPFSLYQHIQRIYATRAFSCEHEPKSPYQILHEVGTSRALLRGVLGRLAEHAGVPAVPLYSRPPWLTQRLANCVSLTSSLGLTLPWGIARHLGQDVQASPGEGEWESIGWDDAGLRYGHSDQARKPEQAELTDIVDQVLVLALRTGEPDFIGSLVLALLRDPESHAQTQKFIAWRLTHELSAFRSADAQILWPTYLSCSDEYLRSLIVDFSLTASPDLPEEVRLAVARILFAEISRTFREAMNADPGSRFGVAARTNLLRAKNKLTELASSSSSKDIEGFAVETAAIVYVIELFSGDGSQKLEHPRLESWNKIDGYWAMVLKAFEFLIDEATAKDHLIHIVEESSLRERGPGVHERLARVLLGLYELQRNDNQRETVYNLISAIRMRTRPGWSSAPLRATLARVLYMEHLQAARQLEAVPAEKKLLELEKLYKAEPERPNLRFELMGALVHSHRMDILRDVRDQAKQRLAYAFIMARADDPPEMRTRLSTIIYNTHRDTVRRREWSDSVQWELQLRQLKDREDASLRSRALHRVALENAIISFQNAPQRAREMWTAIEARYAALLEETTQRSESLIFGSDGFYDWAALGDAPWREAHTAVTGEDSTEVKPRQTVIDEVRSIQFTTESASQLQGKYDTTQPRKGDGRRGACIVVVNGVELGRKFDINEPMISIGRVVESDICVSQDSVSRQHATLTATDDGVRLRDNASTNGTYVNEHKIQEVLLKTGDLITIGPTSFRFLAGDNIESLYYGELYSLSPIEGITQIFDRSHFTDVLGSKLSQAHHNAQPLAFIMFDITYLGRGKAFGHRVAGDFVLRQQIAEFVREHTRKIDVVARHEGVFAIILPDMNRRNATRFAHILRKLVAHTSFLFEQQRVSLTIFVGVAALDPRTTTANALIKTAFARLTLAKRLGRTRADSSDGDEPDVAGS